MKKALSVALLLVGAMSGELAAQPSETDLAEDMHLVTVSTREAVDAGLLYLSRVQAADGGIGHKRARPAITALAGLAFLAGGNVPGRGRYGENVEKCVKFLTGLSGDPDVGDKTGFIRENLPDEVSRMHGHAYATLFLVQVYGMERDQARRDKLRKVIERCIRVIEQAQEGRHGASWGGWGYLPNDNRHEGSITVCCLQALRAARDAGFAIQKPVLTKALRYLIKSAKPDGTFLYRIGGDVNHATLPLTAAAVATFNQFGIYDDTRKVIFGRNYPELPRVMRNGLRYIESKRGIDPSRTSDKYYQRFYYYSEFYAAQVYYKSTFPYGNSRRRLWVPYFRVARDRLLRRRTARDRGLQVWPSDEYSNAYPTAIATMILQIPYKYLPIFQR